MCKCNVVKKFSKHLPFIYGKCRIIKADYTCPMCLHGKRKFTFHSDSIYGVNRCFECAHCHNYVRYYDVLLEHVDQEIFYVLDYAVIMFSDKIILEKQKVKDIILPFFIFSGEADLIKKVKTYAMFS